MEKIEYRPVKFEDWGEEKTGTFHGWGIACTVSETDIITYHVALIELKGGKMVKVMPEKVMFTDGLNG